MGLSRVTSNSYMQRFISPQIPIYFFKVNFKCHHPLCEASPRPQAEIEALSSATLQLFRVLLCVSVLGDDTLARRQFSKPQENHVMFLLSSVLSITQRTLNTCLVDALMDSQMVTFFSRNHRNILWLLPEDRETETSWCQEDRQNSS